jgi:hypothetical protein
MEVVAVGLAPETGWLKFKQKIGYYLICCGGRQRLRNRFNIDLLVSRLIETTEWYEL